MKKRKLTALLCAVAVMGLMLNGCSSSESTETAAEETNGEQQEESSKQQEITSDEQQSTLETMPNTSESQEGQVANAEDLEDTSPALANSTDKNEEITLAGTQNMADAPEIPLNTRVNYTAADDTRGGYVSEEDTQWYMFTTEMNSENLVYQLYVGRVATTISVNIYDDHSDLVADNYGGGNGATVVTDLEDLKPMSDYYIEITGLEGQSYYVEINVVEAIPED